MFNYYIVTVFPYSNKGLGLNILYVQQKSQTLHGEEKICKIFNRPGVAGAVLQTALSLTFIDSSFVELSIRPSFIG